MSSTASNPNPNPISFPFVIHALGNPTVDKDKFEPVQPVTRTVKELAPDEVLVKIEYASINYMDPMLQENNIFGYRLPLVLGFDFSGVVVAVGSSEQAKAFAIGDSVFGTNFAPPNGAGCFATHVVVKYSTVYKNTVIPSAQASTYGVAFITAYESVVTSAKIEQYKGKTIYIPGGAGGVGHFAIQIAKLHGLKVITSTSKQSTLKLLQELKCDHIIDYSKQDVIQTVMDLTNGEGVDVVYDCTYQFASFQKSSQVLKKGGVYIKLGQWETFMEPTQAEEIKHNISLRNATTIIGDLARYSFVPSYISQEYDMFSSACRDALKWYEQGVVRPHIHEIPFNTKSLQQALDTMKQRTAPGGKIVVNIKDTKQIQ